MHQENEVIGKLKSWAIENDIVRAMILTGSRANPKARLDILSDYDIELYVQDTRQFLNDEWLTVFGNVIIRWPLKPMSTIDKEWITRLVLFENGVRIDFQITSNRDKLAESPSHDGGYRVLVDKDLLTTNFVESNFTKYKVKKPEKEEFEDLVNAFFWNATYVAKNLQRDEIYYAKFMLDSMLRFTGLQKILEWYIAMRYDWSINTGKCGRFFKEYLDSKTWKDLEDTFSDASIENNWLAFFNMVNLFRKLAKDIANNLGYEYPYQTDQNVIGYCKIVKASEWHDEK